MKQLSKFVESRCEREIAHHPAPAGQGSVRKDERVTGCMRATE